jgi:hypothetical protein
VVVVRWKPLLGLLTVTVAPDMTDPDASVTVPTIEP